MSDAILVVCFWASAALVAWTWLGFPLSLFALGCLRPRPGPRPESESEPRAEGPLPRVDLLVVAHNEARVIDAKLANLERLDYPRDRLHVVVVSDGSDDDTVARARAHAGPTPVEVLDLPRVGKNAALDAGLAALRGDVVVLSDADSLLEPDALRRLVLPFADPSVGAVAGDFRYVAKGDEGRGERSYWSVDRAWKQLMSAAGGVTSATGQLYALRRELVSAVPEGVTDDFFLSTAAPAAGLRIAFAPEAVARGPVAATPEAELRRKVRLMTRGFASVWSRRELLDPRRSGFYALQLLTHKLLRRLLGIPLIALAVTAPLLWGAHPVYRIAALVQLGFHGLALLGWALRRTRLGRSAPLALPLAFDATHAAGLLAFARFLRGGGQRVWVPEREAAPGAPPADNVAENA